MNIAKLQICLNSKQENVFVLDTRVGVWVMRKNFQSVAKVNLEIVEACCSISFENKKCFFHSHKDLQLFLIGPFFDSFSLFSSFQYS